MSQNCLVGSGGHHPKVTWEMNYFRKNICRLFSGIPLVSLEEDLFPPLWEVRDGPPV